MPLAPEMHPSGGRGAGPAQVWSYDENEGPRAPEAATKNPPGCVILESREGVELPASFTVGGACYRRLRKGFYIGDHADDRDIAGLFDVLAPRYEVAEIVRAFNVAVYEGLARAAEAAGARAPVRTVLDFGCGTGVGAEPLARAFPGAHIYGFDLSPEMQRLAVSCGMSPVSERGGRLALDDGGIDRVIGAFVLHLVRSPKWIREIARVLAPGGTAAFNLYEPRPDWEAHYRAWFRDAGLEAVRSGEERFEGGGVARAMPLVVARRASAARSEPKASEGP